MLSAPEPPLRLLPLKTEIDSESSPSPAATELEARVNAATTVSLPPAARTVAPVAPLANDRESVPSAKETLTSEAEELKTTVSFEVSVVPPEDAPTTEVLTTALLKVRRSAPLPAISVESETVPVSEKRSSP